MFEKDLFDFILDPFDWDRSFYKFNRDEKDMHPYSINDVKENKVIVHNILGIDKKDLKLTRKTEEGKDYLLIEGNTKDEITGKQYSINSKFSVDAKALDLDNISCSAKNGLLYIVIPKKKEELPKLKTKKIEIL